MAADNQNECDRVEPIDNRVEHWHEVRTDDEHLGVCVVDDVLDLWRSETPVDVDAHGIDQRRPEEDLEVLDGVLVEEGDAILVSDAGCGEPVGHSLGVLEQLLP